MSFWDVRSGSNTYGLGRLKLLVCLLRWNDRAEFDCVFFSFFTSIEREGRFPTVDLETRGLELSSWSYELFAAYSFSDGVSATDDLMP